MALLAMAHVYSGEGGREILLQGRSTTKRLEGGRVKGQQLPNNNQNRLCAHCWAREQLISGKRAVQTAAAPCSRDLLPLGLDPIGPTGKGCPQDEVGGHLTAIQTRIRQIDKGQVLFQLWGPHTSKRRALQSRCCTQISKDGEGVAQVGSPLPLRNTSTF